VLFRSYNLTCETASFAVTASAAGLIATRVMPAVTGSFALTGNAAAFVYGRAVVAEAVRRRSRQRDEGRARFARGSVAVARALLQNPRIVLADEPTGNLDSETAEGVMEMLFRINRERQLAFLLVTHNEELAKKCHRVVRLRDGMVVG
jgi:ABC-type thiamine transport system ATPase subunit